MEDQKYRNLIKENREDKENVGLWCDCRMDGKDRCWYKTVTICKELLPGYLSDITGEYATPEGYLVDEKETEEFDKMFPYKEKKKLPGQLF